LIYLLALSAWLICSPDEPGPSAHLISLVHLLHAAHEDLEVDPDEGEECGLEVDLTQERVLFLESFNHQD